MTAVARSLSLPRLILLPQMSSCVCPMCRVQLVHVGDDTQAVGVQGVIARHSELPTFGLYVACPSNACTIIVSLRLVARLSQLRGPASVVVAAACAHTPPVVII